MSQQCRSRTHGYSRHEVLVFPRPPAAIEMDDSNSVYGCRMVGGCSPVEKLNPFSALSGPQTIEVDLKSNEDRGVNIRQQVTLLLSSFPLANFRKGNSGVHEDGLVGKGMCASRVDVERKGFVCHFGGLQLLDRKLDSGVC